MNYVERPFPVIAGGWGTVMADPPWEYEDGGRGSTFYPTMKPHEIAELPVRAVVADEALLVLWTTDAHLLEGHAVRVCKAWGFEPKRTMVWAKGRIGTTKKDEDPRLVLQIGIGSIIRPGHELAIIATRGGYTPPASNRRPSVLLAPRQRHSQKPHEAHELAELLGPGPQLELFARRPSAGWITWGNEPVEDEPPPQGRKAG